VQRYLLSRIINLIPVVFVITFLVFLVTYLIPGDPAVIILGPEASPDKIAVLQDRLGLNRPFHERYLIWLGNVLSGDLGESYLSKEPVASMIARAFPVTLQLALSALLIAFLIAVPTGILSAVKKNSAFDFLATTGGFIGLSVPSFWLGIMLISLFSVRWKILPATGYVGPREDLWLNLKGMILPAFTLGLFTSTQLMRYLRAGILQALNQDHVTTARAKGLGERVVLNRHVIRNALIPFVTVLGLQFGFLLGGSVIIEEVFAIPGMGRLALTSLFNRDYQVTTGIVLIMGVVFVLINLVVDILYSFLDPRIKITGDQVG
jgi:peptide/nickel transport system permease protein